MSISLTSTLKALTNRITSSFLASGGTEPYVYSVDAGGVGGSINASTGLYTAPATGTGVDTVRVTDSLLATTTQPILVGNALELFCDIIQTELGLSQGRVYLWDQKVNQPKDAGLYVAVGVLTCKPFGSTTRLDDSGDAVQSVNMLATLSVDIISRGPDARDRKEEVILALESIYSISQQEANSFYIAPLSSAFVNLSQEDGAAIPYRFNISVNIQYAVKKTKAVPYFDEFAAAHVTTEQ